jgi:predicted anti-sigma-YlaC factor YlaD
MNKINEDFKRKFQGSTAAKPIKVYTGNNVLGITLVHKSGFQPVFSKQQAVEAAQMRR